MADSIVNIIESIIKDLDLSYEEAQKFLDPLNYPLIDGIWLDYIATIVGEDPRIWDPNTRTPDMPDSELRKLIGVRIALNGGSGGTEDVIMAVRRFALMGTDTWDSVKDTPFEMLQDGANILVEVVDGSYEDAYRVRAFVSAGIGFWLGTVTQTPFAFSTLDPGYDPEIGPRGFSNLTTPTDGGDFKFFLTYKE